MTSETGFGVLVFREQARSEPHRHAQGIAPREARGHLRYCHFRPAPRAPAALSPPKNAFGCLRPPYRHCNTHRRPYKSATHWLITADLLLAASKLLNTQRLLIMTSRPRQIVSCQVGFPPFLFLLYFFFCWVVLAGCPYLTSRLESCLIERLLT